MPKQIGDLTLYSVDDLHQQLGLSKMTIRTYLREGKIRGRKLGVSWYVTEEALRDYFNEPTEPEKQEPKKDPEPKPDFKYLIQGVNDLVSEKVEAESIPEAVEIIEAQKIISLFQVSVIDKNKDEIVELVKARDFLERYRDH